MSIVVVSGHRRSGTSMMMRALHEGGLQVLYDKKLQSLEVEPDQSGYAPNHKSGLFEVGYYNQLKPQFMRDLRNRKAPYAVKITWDCLVYLPSYKWTVVFMQRPAEEIDASCARVDDYIRDLGSAKRNDKRNNELKNTSKALPFSCFRRYSHDDVEHVLGIMHERRDVELLVLPYREVIDDPVAAFKRLRYTPLGRERMRIDEEKAASIIDSNLYRVRK